IVVLDDGWDGGGGGGWATTTGWAEGLPWQVGHWILPEPWQAPQLACVVTLPLAPQEAQPSLPVAPHAPQPRRPLPRHLLHWILTSRILPTPISATSPVPLHLSHARAAAPLQVAQATA